MKKVIVRAPVRADLAGGTLDLWPIYLFHPGSRTVNVAISYYAESEICETGDSSIEIHLTDQQYRQRYESLQELAADPKTALIYRALEHFRISGISITTRTDAPRGSGLGGSSALTVTLVRALSEFTANPFEGDDLVFLVRDLETRLLGVPAGIQDYYPPVYGGLAALHLEPGVPVRHAISLPVSELAQHFVLHYTGVSHFSGTNNWQMYKRQVEHKKKVQKGFEKICATSIEMERALESGDMEAAGRALAKEWANRKALIDGISTPEIDSAIDAAIAAGAWGGKVCGAGGGGCVVFLTPKEKREDVIRALGGVAGGVLDVQPVAHGMTVRIEDDTTPAHAPTRRSYRETMRQSVEQLYVSGGRGDYRPYVLAESVIAHIEPRSGVHHTIVRSYVAPIMPKDGSVAWQQASQIDAEKLDIRAVPDPERRMAIDVAPEDLTQIASASEEGFKQFIGETERLRIFHNAAFGLYSDPDETRASFAERCVEEATRRLDDETERLESTFRRRIDQVKERSERDTREIEKDDTVPREPRNDVNVNWGQALYNITSGRPASAVAEAPSSARETDYLDKIAQIQRSWEKELQGKREALMAQAREVEEIEIVPLPKNIDVARYVILWAAGLP